MINILDFDKTFYEDLTNDLYCFYQIGIVEKLYPKESQVQIKALKHIDNRDKGQLFKENSLEVLLDKYLEKRDSLKKDIHFDKGLLGVEIHPIQEIHLDYVQDVITWLKEKRAERNQKSILPEDDIILDKTVNSNYENEISYIKNSDNLFWRGLPMELVVNHFDVMTTKNSSNGKPFLTKIQLISFLKKGFLNETNEPIQKINCVSGEKGFIIKRFYELYDIAVGQYHHPAKKKNFIKLFVDCFDNWEGKTIPNFFKSNKTLSKW